MIQTETIQNLKSEIQNPKIAYIGGGSAYAPGVLRAFANQKELYNNSEVVLVDINTESLDLIQTLGTKIARSTGSDLRITATTDRRAALEGADFVLTSFRVGGLRPAPTMRQIPLRYGVIGQETVGPGGFFFSLRNMAVIKELCAEMEEICPDAWLINYANPTNIIGEAVNRFSNVKVLALCDGGKHDAFHVAELLGYSAQDVEFWGLGLNHATWSTRFTIAGRDGIEMMDEAYDRVLADPSVSNGTKRAFRLARIYRRLPNDYMQYYYFPEETFAQAQAAPLTRAGLIMRDLPSIFEHYREQAATDNPVLTHARGGTGFGEFAVDVISAVATDSGLIEMINRPNNGALPGLPPERVAEVPCRLDAQGATPFANGPLPSELHGLIVALAEYQSLAAEVAWHANDKAAAVRALASNPLTWKLDIDHVEALYNELAQAHARWLSPGLVQSDCVILVPSRSTARLVEIEAEYDAGLIATRPVELCPQFSTTWKDEAYLWTHDGRFTHCGVFASFSHYITEVLTSPEPYALEAVFEYVEGCMHDSGDVGTAAATCFLENLLNRTPDTIDPKRFVPLLGAESREYCRAWDEFCGVRTEGLW